MPIDQLLEPRVWLAIGLAATEVAATMAWWWNRASRQDRQSLRWLRPWWNDLGVLVAAVVALISPVTTLSTSLPWALSVSGLTLFVLGLAVRHLDWVLSALYRHRPDCRPLVARRWPPPAEYYSGSKYPEVVGAASEGMALVVIAARWECLPFAAVMITAAAVAYVKIMDPRVFPGIRGNPLSRAMPGWRPTLIALLIAGVAGTVAGVVSHEGGVFFGKAQDATTMLATLAQVLGTIGVLAITVSFVLAQVLASEVSVRSSIAMARNPSFRCSLGLLLSSLVLDFYLLARSADFPQDAPANLWQVDMALLLALAAVCATAWFVLEAPRLLSPETIVEQELRRFDTRWAKTVAEEWQRGDSRTLHVHRDPLIVIERILYWAIERRDRTTFSTAVYLLGQKLDQQFPSDPDVWISDRVFKERGARPHAIAIDHYLVDLIEGVIDRATDGKDTRALLGLIELWESIGLPTKAEKRKAMLLDMRDALAWDSPDAPGERFLRRILLRSIGSGLVEPAKEALAHVGRCANSWAGVLPAASETLGFTENAEQQDPWRGNGSAEDEAHLSQEEQKRRRENDDMVLALNVRYYRFFSRVAREAATCGIWDIVSSVSFDVISLTAAAFRARPERSIRRRVLNWALLCLSEISDSLCRIQPEAKARIADLFLMAHYGLEEIISLLDPDADQDIASDLADHLVYILKTQDEAGVLSWSLAEDVGPVGRALAGRYSDAHGRILDALALAARHVQDRGWTISQQDRRQLYRSLIGSIGYLGDVSAEHVSADTVLAVRNRVREVLQGLGELVRTHRFFSVPEERKPLGPLPAKKGSPKKRPG